MPVSTSKLAKSLARTAIMIADPLAQLTLNQICPPARNAARGLVLQQSNEKDPIMKCPLKWFTGFALLSAALAGGTAERNAPTALDDKSQQRYPLDRSERLTAPIKATDFTGKEVTNLKQE